MKNHHSAALLIGLLFCHQAVAEDQAEIRIERVSSLAGRFYSDTLFVNGEKLGTLSNGETKTFKFAPKQGNSKFQIEQYAPFGKNPQSNLVELQVAPGDCVVGSIQFVMSAKPPFVLKAEISKTEHSAQVRPEVAKPNAPEAGPKATIKVVRASTLGLALPFNVVLNGRVIGKIWNDSTKEFVVELNRSGRNIVYMECGGLPADHRKKSAAREFDTESGATIELDTAFKKISCSNEPIELVVFVGSDSKPAGKPAAVDSTRGAQNDSQAKFVGTWKGQRTLTAGSTDAKIWECFEYELKLWVETPKDSRPTTPTMMGYIASAGVVRKTAVARIANFAIDADEPSRTDFSEVTVDGSTATAKYKSIIKVEPYVLEPDAHDSNIMHVGNLQSFGTEGLVLHRVDNSTGNLVK